MSKVKHINLNGTTLDIGGGGDVEINYRDDTSLTVTHGTDNYILRTMEKIVKPATPVITDPENDGDKSIEITCSTGGATIYYTTDGSTPTTDSSVYTQAITFYQDETHESYTKTVKAIAVKNAQTSDTASEDITVYRQVATPSITLSGNDYSLSRTATITGADGATLQYSTDGGTTWSDYSAALTISTTTTVKARATKSEWKTSSVASKTCTIGTKKCYIGQAASLSSNTDVEALPNAYEQQGLAGSTKDVDLTTTAQYCWFCVQSNKTITSVTSDGYAVAIQAGTVVGSYKVYRSTNKLKDAGWHFKFV